jgi:hypothetical protein
VPIVCNPVGLRTKGLCCDDSTCLGLRLVVELLSDDPSVPPMLPTGEVVSERLFISEAPGCAICSCPLPANVGADQTERLRTSTRYRAGAWDGSGKEVVPPFIFQLDADFDYSTVLVDGCIPLGFLMAIPAAGPEENLFAQQILSVVQTDLVEAPPNSFSFTRDDGSAGPSWSTRGPLIRVTREGATGSTQAVSWRREVVLGQPGVWEWFDETGAEVAAPVGSFAPRGIRVAVADTATAAWANDLMVLWGLTAPVDFDVFDLSGVESPYRMVRLPGAVWAGVPLVETARPEQFGGRADGGFGFDANMVSGTNVLTSASSAFTSADVGKTICVAEALDFSGQDYGSLVTTITAVNSATQVTLAANCDKTVTNQDYGYGTPADAAFASLVALALANGGADVQLTAGATYLITAAVAVDDMTNLKIRGNGATIFHAQTGHSPNHFRCRGTDGFVIEHTNLMSSYNGYKWGSVGPSAPVQFFCGAAQENRNALVQHCTFRGYGHSAVLIDGQLHAGPIGNQSIRVLHNDMTRGAVPVFVYKAADDIRIHDNTASEANYLCVLDTRAQTDAVVTRSQITRASVRGNRAKTIGGAETTMVANGVLCKGGIWDTEIVGNVIEDIGGDPVSSVGVALTPDWGYQCGGRISINGNKVKNLMPANGAGLPFQAIGPWRAVTIHGNAFEDCDRGGQISAEAQVSFLANTMDACSKTVGSALVDVLMPPDWPGTLISGQVQQSRPIYQGGEIYLALLDHTPGASFAADAANWELVTDSHVKIDGNWFGSVGSLASTAILVGAAARNAPRVFLGAGNTFGTFGNAVNTNTSAVRFAETVVAEGSFAYAGATIGATTTITLATVSVPGVTNSAQAYASVTNAVGFREVILHAQATGAGTVVVTVHNPSAGSVVLPAVTVYWRVMRLRP